MSNNNRLNTEEFYSNIPGQRTLPATYVDYSPENVGNAFALKDAVPFGEAADLASSNTMMGRLKAISDGTNKISTPSYQNRVVLFSAPETTPNAGDVVAIWDMMACSPDNYVNVTCQSSVGAAASLGLSVSNDGVLWEDLYNTGAFSIEFRDAAGNSQGNTGFSVSPSFPVWGNPGFRFVRLVDQGTAQSYRIVVYSASIPPFSLSDNSGVVTQISNLNNIETYRVQSEQFYRVLVASAGFNVGDIAKKRATNPYYSPDNETFVSWTNMTQRAVGLSAPPNANLIEINNANDGQNVSRLVNSTVNTLNVKTTNALIKSIYIDNLGATSYLGIHQSGTATAPVNGSTPLESYRIPANGTMSINLDRVYLGQVWLSFSSTPGAITLASVAKNLIVRFN